MENYNRRQFIQKTTKLGLYSGGIIAGASILTACDKLGNGYYAVDADKCTGTETCLAYCSFGAITMDNGKAVISASRCANCGKCDGRCPEKAIYYVSD